MFTLPVSVALRRPRPVGDPAARLAEQGAAALPLGHQLVLEGAERAERPLQAQLERLDAADSSIAVAPADVAPADATRSAWLARRLAERDKLRAACDAAEARVAELKAGTSN